MSGTRQPAMRARRPWRYSPPVALALLCVADAASAEEKPPVWMVGASGGAVAREGDDAHANAALAVTRKLGRSYVRASVVRFGAALRQVDAERPSTYTLGFLSAGTVIGHWFADGYLAAGTQRYGHLRTSLGRRAINGPRSSGVVAGGVDGGYVAWLGQRWSITPSLSAQYVRSRALREQVGSDGPSEYETRETGATLGTTVRLDRWLGSARQHDLGIHIGALRAGNASAALVSGARDAASPAGPASRQADGWIEVGANASLLAGKRLYVDLAGSRTAGLRYGNVTTTSLGARVLF